MFKSIFEKMFLTSMTIITLVITIATVCVTMVINHYFLDMQYDSIVQASKSLEQWTTYLEVENPTPYSHIAFMRTIDSWAEQLNADIIITNKPGEIIYTTNKDCKSINSDFINKLNRNEIIKKRGKFDNLYSTPVYTVGLPIHYEGNNIGGMYFNIDLTRINRTILFLGLFFYIIVLMGFIIALRLIYNQNQKFTNPLSEINKAVLDIAGGNFKKRIPVRSKDEIGQLASAFNLMADSLEKLESMRVGFISDVSHELRTPMTSISGFVEGILDGTIPPEREKEYLRIVLEETKRLNKLVNNMLEMSKMDSSEYKLNVSEFNINEFIRICIIELEQKICDKGLDLNVDFEKDSIMVCADSDAIKRVFINLIDNAIKFSYPNTTINISTKCDKKKAIITVGNFGIGIDEKDLGNIFTRFYKADKSRTGNKTGFGLGLSFVKNIITLHNQKIWVQSTKAKEGSEVRYTEFTFTLELA